VEPEFYANYAALYPEDPMSIETAIVWSILIVIQACFWRCIITGKFLTFSAVFNTAVFNLVVWWVAMHFTTTKSGPTGLHFVLWMLGTFMAFLLTRMLS
jgi:hypothetical protein